MQAMSISSLKDAVKSLAQSLHVSNIFPAGLLVLVNAYCIYPLFVVDADCTSPQGVTILISLTLMLSYMLYAFNFPLIRFFEGYKLQDDLLFTCLRKFEERRLQSLEDDLWRVQRDFPSGDAILPTKIGNAIAAFEEYSKNRYGMDAVALWPRLVPVLEKGEFLDHVVKEKAVFDFLLNVWFVALVLGVELFYRAMFLGHPLGGVGVMLLTFLVSVILYEGTYIAARQWGTVVRVAFDLYRHDLAQRLFLRPAVSFEEEWDQWEAVSRFFLYRRPTHRLFRRFIPQSQVFKVKEKIADSNWQATTQE